GIRDGHVTGVQTCALPISALRVHFGSPNSFARPADWKSAIQQVGKPALLSSSDALTWQCQEALGSCKALRFSAAGRSDWRSFARSEERRVGKECSTWWSRE